MMINAPIMLHSLSDFISQIPPIPASPAPIKAVASSASSSSNSNLNIITTIVQTLFTGLALYIGFRFGTRKAQAEIDLMDSSIRINQVTPRKIELEQEKLELEILEKKINLDGVIKEGQNQQHLETYQEGLKKQHEYIQKQDSYMVALEEYISWQKQYIEDIGKPNIELIGIVQKLLLRAIALFLILIIYKEFEEFYKGFLDLFFIALHNLPFVFPILAGFEGIYRIILNAFPHAIYEIIIFSWGIQLFEDVNKFVGLDLKILPISLEAVEKVRRVFSLRIPIQ